MYSFVHKLRLEDVRQYLCIGHVPGSTGDASTILDPSGIVAEGAGKESHPQPEARQTTATLRNMMHNDIILSDIEHTK